MSRLRALQATFDTARDTIRTAVGNITGATPARAALAQVAQQSAVLVPVPSIGLHSVVPWHMLATRHTPALWAPDGDGQMRASQLDPRDFQLTNSLHIEHADVDLRAFGGIGASKSSLDGVASLGAFAAEHCKSMLDGATADTALELMRQSQRLFVNGSPPTMPVDTFIWHQWDGRLFFSNSDFSHRFAAASSLASAYDEEILVGAPVRVHTIDAHRFKLLRARFELFLMPSGVKMGSHLHDAMKRLQAPWGVLDMAAAEYDDWLLFLPKDNRRSLDAANTLRENGAPDAGALLQQALSNAVPEFRAFDFEREERQSFAVPRM